MKHYSFYKWRTWSILAVTFILSLFHRGALGVISAPLSQELNASASQIGSLGAITFYTYAFMQIPAGLILDRIGYKRASVIGMLITALSAILLGFADSLTMAYVARFLVGFGTSFLFIAALKAQTIWFAPKEFTKASGYLAFSGNVGGMLSTFPLSLLMSVIGWRFSMLSIGVITLLVGFLIMCFVKSSPKDYGFSPLGNDFKPKKIPLSKTLVQLVKIPAMWRNFFALFSLVGTTSALSGVWGITYIESVYGVSSEMASVLISLMLFGLIAGSLLVNRIVDYFDGHFVLLQRRACLLMMLFVILLILNGQFIGSIYSLGFILFIIGFIAIFHLISFTDIMQHCEGHMLSLSTSAVNAGEFIGGSILSLVIGFTLDLTTINSQAPITTTQFNSSFLIFILVAFIGFLFSFVGTVPKTVIPPLCTSEKTHVTTV